MINCTILKYTSLLLLFIIIAVMTASGQDITDNHDTLAGPLPPLVKARKKPYIVVTNIEVSPQKTVIIEPGVVLLFKNFSGLHVRGRLIARATVDYPIIFTSEFDQSCNKGSGRDANPFDWDGIYMTNSSLGTQLSHCEIRYSVYGLISDTKLIRLDPVTFKDNGKSVIVIENEEIQVGIEPYRHILDQNDPDLLKNAIQFVPDPLQAKRTALRVGSFVTILGGMGVTAVFGYFRYQSYQELKVLSSGEFEVLNSNNGSLLWKKVRKDWIRNMIISDGGLLLTALGVYGVRLSFTF